MVIHVLNKMKRKFKKGSGNYKSKLHFECFNCSEVVHYASKCSKKKKKEHDPREKFRKIHK